MKRKNRGFTLIELLAVIVILGLLMAIAIPSVTKYITQSRKKTVTTTVGNYIGALVNEVNDLQYTFTSYNTVYAVPIECISLERGGTSPFGEWYQANDAYWAYVLIQYDDENSKYIYGFTFKDSAGYGLYPTAQSNIKESGSQIKTGLNLTKPKTGTIEKITNASNWDTKGFDVDSSTSLVVLEAESEGVTGDGKTTCTLCQKGDNYDSIEKEKQERYAIGKEVCFDTECFYIISNDSNTVTLLSKEKIDLTLNNPMQNSNAAQIIFSSTRYWCTYGEIYSNYGNSYPTFVYDFNSTIYQYVEAYEKNLKENFGLSSADASLISHTQLINNLNCMDGCSSSLYKDIIQRSYSWWTGSAYFCDHLLYVHDTGDIRYLWSGGEIGVRPVITVSKVDLNF